MSTKLQILISLLLFSITLPGQASPEFRDFDDSYIANVKHPDWFKESFLNLQDDLQEAQSAGKFGLMVFISTRGCSYCDQFIKTSLSDEGIRRTVQENFDVVGLEIFSDNELTDLQGNVTTVKDYVAREKARFTPTIIFYGENGKQLVKIVGYYPPAKFHRTLSYLIEKKYRTEDFRDYIRNSQALNKKPVLFKSDYAFMEKPPYILDRRLAAAHEPLVVIFEEPGCEACNRFHTKVLTDNKVLTWINRFEVVHLDMTDDKSIVLIPTGEKITSKQWSEKLGLNNSLAVVFFNEHGKEVVRIDAEVLKHRMAGTLEFVFDKGYLLDNQFQRWRAIKAQQKKSQPNQVTDKL